MRWRRSGAGPAVLLLHGIPTNGRLWDEIVPVLAPSFTCIVVDLPAVSDSPGRADTVTDLHSQVAQLEGLRCEQGVSQWHVVGHDAGATLAVHYAVAHPGHTSRLVLSSPALFPELRIPWFFRVLRTPRLGEVLAPVVVTPLYALIWLAGVRRHTWSTLAAVRSFQRRFQGRAGARRFLRLLRWGEPATVLRQTAELLPRVAAPTLLLQGRQERVIPSTFYDRAALRIPRAEIEILEAGHFQPLDRPEEFGARVLRFLRASNEPRGAAHVASRADPVPRRTLDAQ